MKKLSIVFLCFLSVVAMAQDDTSSSEPLKGKDGVPILPEAGEWAIGIEADPFLQYMGNLFNDYGTNAAPFFNSAGSGVSLLGKYMKDAKTAYRVRLALNRDSRTLKNLVDDDADDESAQVEDKVSVGATNVFLGAGIEKRRGKGRLQGFYGAEVGVGFTSSGAKYTYGNAFDAGGDDGDEDNATFTEFDVDNLSVEVDGIDVGGARITEEKSGTSISFGVNGFIGVEYFIAPKVALGGELGFGVSLSTSPKGKSTVETADESTTTDFSSSTPGSFHFGTVPTGSINLIFYF